MDYLYQILTFVGICLAGWFVATDKNRNELFKTKLALYQDINKQVARVFSCAMYATAHEEQFIEEYSNESLRLYEMVFESTILLPKESTKEIMKFLEYAPDKREEQLKTFNKITEILAKDINLDRLEAITKISCIQYDELQKKLTKKAKDQ